MQPAYIMPTDRGLTKFILLGIITFGIYQLVVLTKISSEINLIASKNDGKSTMNFCLIAFIFSWLTLGIAPLVWWHRICNRIGNEQIRRGLPQTVSAGTFWGWNIIGSLIVVGPFIFLYKFLHAMNDICANYNVRG